MMRAEGVEWCAFLDADEFIGNGAADGASAAAAETFSMFLGRHASHCAIGLNWALFGSAGHMERPPGLLQEAFLRRAEDGFAVQRHIKSLVRPQYTMGVHHAHGFALSFRRITMRGARRSYGGRRSMASPVVPFAYTETAPVSGWLAGEPLLLPLAGAVGGEGASVAAAGGVLAHGAGLGASRPERGSGRIGSELDCRPTGR